ncbi:hypothetical protein BTJ39_23480, partial [Izhakiella australiensis]
MNKNLYRVIFNRVRGLLMVVAETARACNCVASSVSRGHTLKAIVSTLTPIGFALLLAAGAVNVAQAGVVANGAAPGSQQPTIINSANGTPQVNIQAPSAAGVSHNRYSQFDVERRGLILNNSHQDVQTQLGGMVAKNPWLAQGEARVILNEVNSRDPSRLNGFIEVAGRKAEVVIANPAGITCNGCGFINANRTTLTTGQPQMQNGHLTGYVIERGEITISGAGMDSTGQDYTDIIARSVKINARLSAQNLRITTGRNRVDAAHQTLSALQDDNSTKPQMALDVASLGGMYAGKIRLIGTERGVGVHNAGEIGASAGNVTLSADGSIANSGAMYASNRLAIKSHNHLNNSGSLGAGGDLNARAAEITSTTDSSLTAGLKQKDAPLSAGNIILTSKGQLTARGKNQAGSDITFRGTGVNLANSVTTAQNISVDAQDAELRSAGAHISAKQQLRLTNSDLLNNDDGTLSAEKLTLGAKQIANRRGTLEQTGRDDLDIRLTAQLDNQQGNISTNSDNLTISAAEINNQHGTISQAGSGEYRIDTSLLNGTEGSLLGKGNLLLFSHEAHLDNSTTSARNISITSNTLTHAAGDLSATGDLHFNGQLLDNHDGKMTADGKLDFQLDTLVNQRGQLIAGQDLTLATSQINNTQGQLVSVSGKGTITSQQELRNRGGHIESMHDLTLTSAGLSNQSGKIIGQSVALKLESNTLNNEHGIIAAEEQLSTTSGLLINDSGLLQSTADMHINTGSNSLLNHDSHQGEGIISRGKLTLETGDIINQRGVIISNHDLQLTSAKIDNSDGIIATKKMLKLTASQLDNHNNQTLPFNGLMRRTARLEDQQQGGIISADGNLILQADNLFNQNGELVSGAFARLNFGHMSNQAGQLTSEKAIELTGEELNNDNRGLVHSGKNLTINVTTLSNRNSGDKGGLIAHDNLTINNAAFSNNNGIALANQSVTFLGQMLDNSDGAIVAQDKLSLDAVNGIINQRGLLEGKGVTVKTYAQRFDNRNGTLHSLAQLNFNGGEIDNRTGTIDAKNQLELNSTDVDNQQNGLIIGQGKTRLISYRVDNRSGQIQSLGNLLIDSMAGILNNTSGLIRGSAQVTLKTDRLFNNNTQDKDRGIEGDQIVLTSNQLQNNNGRLLANKSAKITNQGELNNTAGEITAGETLELLDPALKLNNYNGLLQAGKLIDIEAMQLGGDGKILSLGDIKLKSNKDFNNRGDVIANNNLSFTSTGNVTNNGKLQAGSQLNLTARQLLNQSGGEINSGQTNLTISQTLTNYGLIDGSHTFIDANTLDNIGTGRIYGDAIGINTQAFNNLAQNGVAATLAGRQQVDIGTNVLNNHDHALIYSDGVMAIGGALDNNRHATGRAQSINNHSATIESAGEMQLAAEQINNINDRFSTELALVDRKPLIEYEFRGVRYTPDKYDISTYQDEVTILCIKGVICGSTDGDNFYLYRYIRTTEETRIKETDPAKIVAGGDLNINAGKVLNDKSQLVAGGVLSANAVQIDNVEVAGERHITDSGSAEHYYRIQKKHSDDQGRKQLKYAPPTTIQDITLKPSQLSDYTAANMPDIRLPTLPSTSAGVRIGKPGGIRSALPGSEIKPTIQLPAPVKVSPDLPVELNPGQQFEVALANSHKNYDLVVRITSPDIHLPNNSLFITNPTPSAHYLVETDPRFTNRKTWLSSDYMMKQFTSDPGNVHKRLGDGFYEQRLVREQLIKLTGQRYLQGFNNDEAQYKSLMDNGLNFARHFNLAPGVALSPQQMSLLTNDMVWLVNKKVTLADGSVQTVLVPQLYARVKEGDIDGSGALLSGKEVNLKLDSDLLNSGTLSSVEHLKVNADNILNQSGKIKGADVRLAARRDINLTGGLLHARDNLFAHAGRDIHLLSTTRNAENKTGNADFSRTTINNLTSVYVQGADGKLELQADRNLDLTAAQITNSGENSQTWLRAGQNLTLGTVTTASKDNLVFSSDDWNKQYNSQQVGSAINAKGDVTLTAGNNASLTAASVSAGDKLNLQAGNDLSVSHGVDTADVDQYFKISHRGFLSKTTTETRLTTHQEQVNGSLLSGDNITLNAGNDLSVTASNIAATHDATLNAGNDLAINDAVTRQRNFYSRSEKKSGLMGTGGIGVTAGKQSLKTTDESDSLLSNGSTVGSSQGSLHLSAGNRLDVKGADLIAGHDMTLSGKEVSISATENRISQTHSIEQKQSGLTLALSGSVGEAINVAVAAARASQQESDSRLAALQATKSALAGVQAYQAQQLSALNAGNGEKGKPSVGVMLSAGAQSSRSRSHLERRVMSASTLNAGHDLNITASGGGRSATSGDISINGSQLKAGHDASLSAARDIHLSAAADRQKLEGSNSSSGGSVGVGLTAGSGGTGLTFSASANAAHGSEHGNGTTWNETTLDAGSRASLKSGRDTALTGAQVSAGRITANTGRDLTLRSLQDSDRYDSRQQSVSAGASATLGVPGGSASLSVSRDRLHSNYNSVREQTGLFAGDGGFDVTTGRHTQLDGAVIASTASAGKNRLDTGTLGFSDIHNQADFSTEHQGVSLSSSGGFDPVANIRSNAANLALSGAGHSGHDEGTTRAAVSAGSLVIRDGKRQQQDVARLSRDADHANSSIGQIFDKKKEQRRLQAAQLMGEIGGQVSDIARTQGQIAGEKAKRDPQALKRAEAQ